MDHQRTCTCTSPYRQGPANGDGDRKIGATTGTLCDLMTANNPTPLVQWQPSTEADKPLVPIRCHVRVATEGANPRYYQCSQRPTTTRPMRSIFSDAPVARPVCGTHKRVHDDAIDRAERGPVEVALRAAIVSRFRTRVAGTALDGVAELVEPINLASPRVTLPFTLLESLLEGAKPVEDFRPGDLVAFIVRDRDRTRYQGVGRVKSVHGDEFLITDTISSRRYKVPRRDLKRARPKVER